MNRKPCHSMAAALVAGTLLAVGPAVPVLGHSAVTTSSPRHGSTLERFPTGMTLRFGDPIGRLGTMTVTRNGAGDLVKSVRISPENARAALITLKRPGPKKRAGLYRLTWRVTGADGHPVSGIVVFRVRPS